MYHMSGNEMFQCEYMNKKTPKDFIEGGTTQNHYTISLRKRFVSDCIELDAWFQHEGWKAPIYLPALQKHNAFAAQVSLFPHLATHPHH